MSHGGPAGLAGAGLDVSAVAQLCASLNGATAEMREQARRRRQVAASLWPVHPPAVPLASLPALRSSDGGPNTGYFWAVQRITVGPFGAGSDLVTVYRGASAADVQPQNALNSFFTAQVGAFVPWHVGGKGLILMPDESLIFAGVITGASPMANVDAHQGLLDVLVDYIM
jgi:hypothetical protein